MQGAGRGNPGQNYYLKESFCDFRAKKPSNVTSICHETKANPILTKKNFLVTTFSVSFFA